MKYKNLNSGTILDFPCEVAGGGWVPYVEKPKASSSAPASRQEKEKTQAPRKRGKKLQ